MGHTLELIKEPSPWFQQDRTQVALRLPLVIQEVLLLHSEVILRQINSTRLRPHRTENTCHPPGSKRNALYLFASNNIN